MSLSWLWWKRELRLTLNTTSAAAVVVDDLEKKLTDFYPDRPHCARVKDLTDSKDLQLAAQWGIACVKSAHFQMHFISVMTHSGDRLSIVSCAVKLNFLKVFWGPQWIFGGGKTSLESNRIGHCDLQIPVKEFSTTKSHFSSMNFSEIFGHLLRISFTCCSLFQ